jgi:hypothetical protein
VIQCQVSSAKLNRANCSFFNFLVLLCLIQRRVETLCTFFLCYISREVGDLIDNMFYLNLATLLKTLDAASAILMAELPDGIPGYAEPCKGYISVQNNSILGCAIVSNGKVVAQGRQALQFLENHRAWHIRFPPDLLDRIENRSGSRAPSPRGNVTQPLSPGRVTRSLSLGGNVTQPLSPGRVTRSLSPPRDELRSSSDHLSASPTTGPLQRSVHWTDTHHLSTTNPEHLRLKPDSRDAGADSTGDGVAGQGAKSDFANYRPKGPDDGGLGPRTTRPLTRHTTEEASLYMVPQRDESSIANPRMIVDSRVFHPRVAFTAEMLRKYNPEERLILRTVYSNIDGLRRVDQLKRDLQFPSAMIERALVELQRLGIIN